MEKYTDSELDQMFQDGLLCEVCQERPLSQAARFHDCMVCEVCAEGEPEECCPAPEDIDLLVEQWAADEEAELAYQEMLDQEAFMAEQEAASRDAERAYNDNTITPVETDLF